MPRSVLEEADAAAVLGVVEELTTAAHHRSSHVCDVRPWWSADGGERMEANGEGGSS